MEMVEICRALASQWAMRLLCVPVAAAELAGCANMWPRPISATERRGIFVWPLAACASDPGGEAAVAPLVAAVATPLLNNLFGGQIGCHSPHCSPPWRQTRMA